MFLDEYWGGFKYGKNPEIILERLKCSMRTVHKYKVPFSFTLIRATYVFQGLLGTHLIINTFLFSGHW